MNPWETKHLQNTADQLIKGEITQVEFADHTVLDAVKGIVTENFSQ